MLPFHSVNCVLFVFVVTCAEGLPLMAQPPAPGGDAEKRNIEAALKLTRESAAKYELLIQGAARPLELRPEPVLRWSNPENGQIYGNVYVWTRGGRPEVVASLFKWFAPLTHMSHEFHSLTGEKLSARYEGKEVWKTAQPGVSFAPVPDAGDVAATPAARLTQMRQLARQFTARSVDRKGVKSELRQLPQPVYRYELDNTANNPLDGALFTFVQGTDPEVWLMLEARQENAQPPARWHYATARMNSIELTVDYNGKTVWHCDQLPFQSVQGHALPYTSFRFDQP